MSLAKEAALKFADEFEVKRSKANLMRTIAEHQQKTKGYVNPAIMQGVEQLKGAPDLVLKKAAPSLVTPPVLKKAAPSLAATARSIR